MRNPPIVRAVVSDINGYVIYDSTAKPWRWRREHDDIPPATAWPDTTRALPRARRCEIPQPMGAFSADPAERRAVGALVAGLAIALACGAAIAAIAVMVAR